MAVCVTISADGTTEAIQTLADYELSVGVTTICPATMTFSEEILAGIMKAAASYENKTGAELVGINMEGPFISPAKKGAQNGIYIHNPDVAMFRRLQEISGGLIKLCDIAPETEGSMEFIDELKDEVGISIAHTTADYDIAKEAYDRGPVMPLIFHNAMPPFSHPGSRRHRCRLRQRPCTGRADRDGVHRIRPLYAPPSRCLVTTGSV